MKQSCSKEHRCVCTGITGHTILLVAFSFAHAQQGPWSMGNGNNTDILPRAMILSSARRNGKVTPERELRAAENQAEDSVQLACLA